MHFLNLKFLLFLINCILHNIQHTVELRDGFLTYTNHWTCKRRNLVVQDWFSLLDSFLLYLLWALCLWSGTLAPASWARSLGCSSDHPCNCGSHRARGHNPTCGRQTSCQQTTASSQNLHRGNPAPAEWQWEAFRLMLQPKPGMLQAVERLTCPRMIIVVPRMFEPEVQYFFIRNWPLNHSCTSPDSESHVVQIECHALGL